MTGITDAHVHVGGCMSTCFFTDHVFTGQELVDQLDAHGVERAIVSGGGKPHGIKSMNEMALASIRDFPGRLVGLVRVHPLLPDWETTIDSYIGTHGFRGVKLHPTQDAYTALDPGCHSVVEKAEELGVPVLVHSGTMPYAMPGQIADLAAAHPKATIIMAHAGRGELYQHTVPSAARVENLLLEFSFQLPSSVRSSIDAIGSERVMYGTNWPAVSMKPWLETVQACRTHFSDAELQQFLGLNAERVYGVGVKRDDRA